MNLDKIKFTPPVGKTEGTQYPAVFKYIGAQKHFYVLAFSDYNGVVISEGGESENCPLGECSGGFDFRASDVWENLGPVTVKIDFDN